jgi:hypothetical protein
MCPPPTSGLCEHCFSPFDLPSCSERTNIRQPDSETTANSPAAQSLGPSDWKRCWWHSTRLGAETPTLLRLDRVGPGSSGGGDLRNPSDAAVERASCKPTPNTSSGQRGDPIAGLCFGCFFINRTNGKRGAHCVCSATAALPLSLAEGDHEMYNSVTMHSRSFVPNCFLRPFAPYC